MKKEQLKVIVAYVDNVEVSANCVTDVINGVAIMKNRLSHYGNKLVIKVD